MRSCSILEISQVGRRLGEFFTIAVGENEHSGVEALQIYLKDVEKKAKTDTGITFKVSKSSKMGMAKPRALVDFGRKRVLL